MAHIALSHILAFKGLLGGHKPTIQDAILGAVIVVGFVFLRGRRR